MLSYTPGPQQIGRTGSLRVYGDSKARSSEDFLGTNRLGDRYGSRLAVMLGAYPRNYGVGGTCATFDGVSQVWPQRNNHTFTETPAFPTTPDEVQGQVRAGLHILDAGFNDGQKVNDDALWPTYKHVVRSLIYQSRAQYAWPCDSAAFTLTGWTQNAFNASFGSKNASRTTNGSIVWASGSSGSGGGTLVFYFLVFSGLAPTGRRFRGRAKIGSGSYVATLDAAGEALGVAGVYSLCCLPVSNVPTGNQTVTVDVDTITSTCHFVGATLEPTTSNVPTVLLVGQPQTPVMPWPGDANHYWTQTAHDTCNTQLTALCSEFSRVIYCSVDSVSQQQRYVHDNVHLANHGEAEKLKLLNNALVNAGGIGYEFSGRNTLVSGTPTFSMEPGQTAYDPSTHTEYRAEGLTGSSYVSTVYA